jgi:hypothetical protein
MAKIQSQAAIKSAIETFRVKFAWKTYIIGKCTFLVDSQILNWTNKASIREELPLWSFGLKKLSTVVPRYASALE